MKKFIKLGFIIVWCILIFLFSNENSSQSNSRSKNFLSDTIEIYEKVVDRPIQNKSNFIIKWNRRVRKLAHFSIYFIFGIFVFWCFGDFISTPSKRICFSLLFCFVCAMVDEVHQFFILGRTASLFDIMIDFLGSVFSVTILVLSGKFRKKRLEQK